VNINKGEAFYGEVDILGKPYVTGYDPIKDASGKVIGIWYVTPFGRRGWFHNAWQAFIFGIRIEYGSPP